MTPRPRGKIVPAEDVEANLDLACGAPTWWRNLSRSAPTDD
jgi:hypothetical protein